MQQCLAVLIILALQSVFLGARAVEAQETSAAGLWQQVDPSTGKVGGWFLMFKSSSVYEGTPVKMFREPGEDPNPICTKCPGIERNAPWLGLTIIKGMERKGLDHEHGSILDPRDGTEYHALMHLSPDGRELRCRELLRETATAHEMVVHAGAVLIMRSIRSESFCRVKQW
jgi:Uncharacterized protein conserved in bacteria (DUF2147)